MFSSQRIERRNPPSSQPTQPSSWITICKYAVPLITGVGGLIVGWIGLNAYSSLRFTNQNPTKSLSMITSGLAIGIPAFIYGTLNLAKYFQTLTPNHLEFGPDAWNVWGVEIVDEIPDIPEISWDERDPYFDRPLHENYALLYIPKSIRVNEEEKELTPNAMKEITHEHFGFFGKTFKEQYGDQSIPSGWILASKDVIPDSRRKNYTEQKSMVEEKGDFHMPYALEAMVLNLLTFATKGQKLYGLDPKTYTRCIERVEERSPIVVGGFGPDGLRLMMGSFDCKDYGVAAVRRYTDVAQHT